MSIQVTSTILRKETVEHIGWAQRLGLFFLFLMCGVTVFVFGSNYYEIFPTNRNIYYNAVLSAVFLIVSLWLKRNERLTKYWHIPFAFFIASFVILFTLLFDLSGSVLGWFNLTTSTSQGIAIAKLFDMVMIVVLIIVLTKLSGADLGSIYLKRGNLKWGLSIGAIVLFNFASSAILFFATRYTSIDKLIVAILWGVVFSFANSLWKNCGCAASF